VLSLVPLSASGLGLGDSLSPPDDEGDGDWPPVVEVFVPFVTFVSLEMSVAFVMLEMSVAFVNTMAVPFVTFVELIVPFEYCDETWHTNRTNTTT